MAPDRFSIRSRKPTRRRKKQSASLIRKECPDDAILGEEHGHHEGSSGRTWIVDPIDGTRAFITGRHTWGTLIALCDGNEPVLGIIDQPVLKERFVGYPGTRRTHHSRGP